MSQPGTQVVDPSSDPNDILPSNKGMAIDFQQALRKVHAALSQEPAP